MVREFTDNMQGHYGPNKIRLYSGVVVVLLFVSYLVSNFSNAYNTHEFEKLLLYYFILTLITIVAFRIKKGFGLKLIINKKSIEYSYKKERIIIFLDQISKVTYEASNISIYCGKEVVKLPPFGKYTEYDLIDEFKRLGIPCHEYVTD